MVNSNLFICLIQLELNTYWLLYQQNLKLDRDKKLFLQNTSILDIGCGGGLISEPLSRLGANVTGIDASKKNIQVASLHSKKNNLKIKYIQSSPEQMNTDEKFDVILNLEIVEHVENLDLYLNSCSSLLKKGGVMFTATINRTLVSYIKAIVGAEYILRWLPVGTHDWNKFIKPEELENKFDKLKLCIIDTSGLSYNPISKKWKKSSDLSVNYIITTKKFNYLFRSMEY